MRTPDSLGERELGVTSTPRQTWVWATSPEQCEEVRAVIDAAGGLARWSQATRYGQVVENASDIDIGADAMDATDALEAAGFTLVAIQDPHAARTWN